MTLFLIWQAWVTCGGGAYFTGSPGVPTGLFLLLHASGLTFFLYLCWVWLWHPLCTTTFLNPFMFSSRMLHGTEKSLAHQTDEADRPGKEELLRGPSTSFFASALHLRIAKQLSLWDGKARGLWWRRKFSVKVDTSVGNNPLAFTSHISRLPKNQLS